MDCSPLGAEEKFVIGSCDVGEEHSFSRYGAHELSLGVENQNLSIHSEDHQEASQLCHMALLYVLFNVDPLLELEVPLVELPEFDAGFLDSEELDLVSQIYLSSLPEGTVGRGLPRLERSVWWPT